MVLTTAGPVRDADLGWHLQLGREVLAGADPADAGTDWTAVAGDPQWSSGQWLSEVALAGSHDLWGSTGPIVLRVLSTVIALIVLAACTGIGTRWECPRTDIHAGFPSVSTVRQSWALIGFLCGAWVLMGFAQERPQQVSFIAFPLVGLLVARLLHPTWLAGLTRVRLWGLVAVIITAGSLWARCHQGWLLAALLIGLISALSTARLSRRLILLGAVAMAVTCSPHGWGSVREAFGISRSAADLSEWLPTDFFTLPAAASLLLAFALVIKSGIEARQASTSVGHRATLHSWLRREFRRSRWPRWLLLAILGMLAASAGRHLAATVLIAVPLLTAGGGAGTPASPRRPATERWPDRMGQSLLTSMIVGVAAILSATLAITFGVNSPDLFIERAAMAARLACHAKPHPAQTPPWEPSAVEVPVVIATTYNDSGTALWGARNAPCPGAAARVVIDGRADRYGAAAIRSWQRTTSAQGAWRRQLEDLHVDAALLPDDSPLAGGLRAEGWRIVEHGNLRVALVRVDTRSEFGRVKVDGAPPSTTTQPAGDPLRLPAVTGRCRAGAVRTYRLSERPPRHQRRHLVLRLGNGAGRRQVSGGRPDVAVPAACRTDLRRWIAPS